MFVDLIGFALFLLSVAAEQLPFLLPLKHELVAVLCCLTAFGCYLLPKRFFSAMAVSGIASRVILVVGILVTGIELSFITGAASDQLITVESGRHSTRCWHCSSLLPRSQRGTSYLPDDDRPDKVDQGGDLQHERC